MNQVQKPIKKVIHLSKQEIQKLINLPFGEAGQYIRQNYDPFWGLSGKGEKEKVYEVSFWYKTLDRLDLDNILNIKEINGTNDTTTLNSKNIKSMINVQDKKVFATLLFKTDHPENKIIISLKGISDREKVFYLDDLMIRAKDNDVFKVSYSPVKKDSVLKINNIDTYMKTNR